MSRMTPSSCANVAHSVPVRATSARSMRAIAGGLSRITLNRCKGGHISLDGHSLGGIAGEYGARIHR